MPIKFLSLFLSFFVVINSTAMAQSVTGPQHSSAPLNFTEVDGSPSTYPYKIKVSNGTLTDNGDGTVSLTTGGGSGGSSQWITVTNVGIGTTDNVGIGSLNPGSKLDVFGSMRVLNSGHITTEGVTATGATGTGRFVFDGTPTLVTPVIGAATGTSVALSGNVGINGAGITNNLGIIAASDSGIIMTGVGDMYAQFNQPSNTAKDTHVTAGNTDIVSVGSTHTFNAGPFNVTGFASRYNNSNNVMFEAGIAQAGTAKEWMWFRNNVLDTMILSGGNNVGIGTAMPSSLDPSIPNKLYVNGTGEMSGFKLNTGAAAGNVLVSNTVGVGTWMAPSTISAGGGSGTVNSGTANQAARYASTGTAVSGSTLIYDDLTNVGVGTVTPVATLNISSTANQDLFRVDDNATNDLSPFVINKDGNVGIGTTNTQTDKLLVMGGNVGIGTWVPNTTLDVKGSVIISDNTGIGTITPTALLNVASTVAQDLLRVDDNATGDPSPFIIDQNGAVGIGTTIASNAALSVMSGNVGIGTWKPTGSLQIVGAGNVGIGTLNPGATLDVNGTLRTLGAGNNILTANVGIGSSTPGATLDVQGTLRLNGTGANSFRIQAGGNIACTTTCTTGKAIVGLDQGTLGVVLPSLVGPADATADQCLCGS